MKLIDNAKQWYKFWSIKLSALGAFLMSAWFVYGDSLTLWWSEHAINYFGFLGVDAIKWIGLALVIIGQIARIVKQPELHKGEQP